jgi:hypothetical protein
MSMMKSCSEVVGLVRFDVRGVGTGMYLIALELITCH